MKFATLATLAATASVSFAAPTAESRQLGCDDVYLYFARGTTEIGTLGVLGIPLASALRSELRGLDVTVEGVPYPAEVPGFLIGGSREGARNMHEMATSTMARCPDAKVFIGGYSQGGQVTHLAAAMMTTAEQERILGVVTFGDPNRDDRLPGTLENRRLTFCNFGDLICTGSSILLPPHFTYGSDVDEAAEWIADRAR